ncbi:MAG: HD domain-containing protein [Betaproteobacteria bacterium]
MRNASHVDLTQRFGFASAFALTLHNGQRRKGSGVPYYAHLMAVAASVLDHGGDEDMAIAALLHDAVEDQGGRRILEMIRERYGKGVADIVLAVSDCVEAPKPPWAKRKADYIARLVHASVGAKLVAAADKLHNLRCTVADVRSDGVSAMLKFNAPAADIVAYYDACIAAVADGIPATLRSELDWTLAELRMLLAMPRPVPFPHARTH